MEAKRGALEAILRRRSPQDGLSGTDAISRRCSEKTLHRVAEAGEGQGGTAANAMQARVVGKGPEKHCSALPRKRRSFSGLPTKTSTRQLLQHMDD
jgi:hypothetical protein